MSNFLNKNTIDADSLLLSLRDAQLRIILETTQDAIVITDDQGCYLDVNPAACQLFGFEKEQLLGRCILDFTEPSFNPPQNWQEFLTLENRLDEFRLLRPDGQLRIVAYIARMDFLPHHHLLVIRDITEQKQTQERIKALEKLLSETEETQEIKVVLPIDHPELQTTIPKNEAELAYFQKITRYIPGAIYQFTKSADGKISLPYASEGLKAIYGLSPAEVREDATLFLAQLHPDDYAPTIEAITESATHLTRWYCEYRICRDEEIFWLLGDAIPQRDSDGGTTWYGYIRDITDQKAKEADLAKISRYLKKAQEVAKLGYWSYHLATEKLTWSEEIFRIFGMTPDQGEPALTDHLQQFHPDDRNFFLERVTAAIQGTPQHFDSRILLSQGEIRYINIRIELDWLEGQVVELFGIVMDISEQQAVLQERKQVELELESFFTVSLDLLCIADVEGRFLRLNKAWEDVLGYTTSELEKEPFLAFVHPDDIDSTLAVIADLAKQSKVTKFINRYQAKDGSYHYLEWRSSPQGELIYASARDITEHIQTEQAILQKSQELEKALQDLQNTQMQLIQSEKMSSLGQLVGGIAHEINNPVSFIYGNLTYFHEYTQNLLELVSLYQASTPHPPSQITEFMETIDLDFLIKDMPKTINSMCNGALRIRDIVKSLRTFSQLDEVGLKSVNLHNNLDNTLVILQNKLQRTGGNSTIQVIKNYGDLPLVECYGDLLNQVFMNLLVNAIQAIEERQVKALHPDYRGIIRVTTSLEPSDLEQSSYVSIAIEDNGMGMSPEIQAQIFNPFFTTKPIGTGTGMGLAIGYQIVTKNHQGELFCSSTPGKGSKLTMKLPIHATDF
jgi:PAS domain S-box-containing protein